MFMDVDRPFFHWRDPLCQQTSLEPGGNLYMGFKSIMRTSKQTEGASVDEYAPLSLILRFKISPKSINRFIIKSNF